MNPFLRRSLLLALVFLPAIITIVFTMANAVNVPVWDDWERGVMLKKWNEGGPDLLEYMTGAHIDHRMIVPRFLILASNAMTGGDLRWEIALNLLLYTAGGVGLFFVLRRTLGESTWFYFTAFLVNAAIFSPVQYQNFLWAVQIAMLLPFACLGLMLWCYHSRRLPIWLRWFLVALCTWCGTFSFGHGLVLWPVAICLGFLHENVGSWKQRIGFGSAMLAFGVAIVLVYFLWNFQNVSEHAYGQMPGETPPGILTLQAEDKPVWTFVLSSLGNASGRFFPDVVYDSFKSGSLALILALGFGGASLTLLYRRKDRSGFQRLLPWFAVLGFAIVTMFAMANGRSTLGWHKAVLSRYAGASVFFSAATIVLASWCLLQLRQAAATDAKKARITMVTVLLATIWACYQTPTWTHSLLRMENWKHARYQQQAALLYSPLFKVRQHNRQDSTIEFALEQAEYLDEQGLLSPPLVREPGFGPFVDSGRKNSWSRARVTSVRAYGPALTVSGFAWLESPDRISDGVLVTARPKDGSADWVVVEMVEMKTINHDPDTMIDRVFGGTPDYHRIDRHAAWEDLIPLERFPFKGEIELGFWSMDVARLELQRIKASAFFSPEGLQNGVELFDAEESKALWK